MVGMTHTGRRLLWPGVMTAGMLIVLLGLGTWQVQRLFWKQLLLAQIEHAEAAAPIPLPLLQSYLISKCRSSEEWRALQRTTVATQVQYRLRRHRPRRAYRWSQRQYLRPRSNP
jgi:hypothetical protein